ncbi:hypothetical protein MAPG_10528 [Magnaporthiopsis poae ATCC 64411]|uniref:Heterokaryon incompatibility domain-containing protein n=1 Tax=Magnaporthiopsis poae (strain ATCC 64411 / 73-15) TaxID=644358 RepID=A0A0C4ECU3_MAGP6|nr:hypothetical protein MAPG_10528 [Magnaporthiopsis poae ATCC 64411]
MEPAQAKRLSTFGRGLITGRRHEEELYTKEDNWDYHSTWADADADHEFFRSLDNDWSPAKKSAKMLASVGNADWRPQHAALSRLCDFCSNFLSRSDSASSTALSEIQEASASCELCLVAHHCLEDSGTDTTEARITFRREGSNFYIEAERQPRDEMITLSIVSAGGEPRFPLPGSPAYFAVLQSWVQDCNGNHRCWPNSEAGGPLPTRVLDIGDGGSGTTIRLRETKGERGKYIAVSHRWGDEAVHRPFCTYKCNMQSRLRGFPVDDLPKTFRDVITVARELGVQYLWIDSLCIVQRHAGCSNECGLPSDDFLAEARKMEAYYSHAYLTVAATAAEGNSEGILTARRCVVFRDTTGSTSYAYRRGTGFRFATDVEEAGLNNRAWVLQERALSRRTLHFTGSQVYWECGEGSCCESVPDQRKTNDRSGFMSDPNFPDKLGDLLKNRYDLVMSLYHRYTTLGITVVSDRPLAISGLEQRLSTKLNVEARYGTFTDDGWLHRTLLWQRGSDQSMQPVEGKLPTWSWMAHDGTITFPEWCKEPLDIRNDVCFKGASLYLRARKPPTSSSAWRGGVIFDGANFPTEGVVLAVVARRWGSGRRSLVPRGRADDNPAEGGRWAFWRRRDTTANGTKNETPREDGDYYVLVLAPFRSKIGLVRYKRIGAGRGWINFSLRGVDGEPACYVASVCSNAEHSYDDDDDVRSSRRKMSIMIVTAGGTASQQQTRPYFGDSPSREAQRFSEHPKRRRERGICSPPSSRGPTSDRESEADRVPAAKFEKWAARRGGPDARYNGRLFAAHPRGTIYLEPMCRTWNGIPSNGESKLRFLSQETPPGETEEQNTKAEIRASYLHTASGRGACLSPTRGKLRPCLCMQLLLLVSEMNVLRPTLRDARGQEGWAKTPARSLIPRHPCARSCKFGPDFQWVHIQEIQGTSIYKKANGTDDQIDAIPVIPGQSRPE